jgi:hypothetical protein
MFQSGTALQLLSVITVVVFAVVVSVVPLVLVACVVNRKPPKTAAKAISVSKVNAMIFLLMLIHLHFVRFQLAYLVIKRFFRIIPNYVLNLAILAWI